MVELGVQWFDAELAGEREPPGEVGGVRGAGVLGWRSRNRRRAQARILDLLRRLQRGQMQMDGEH